MTQFQRIWTAVVGIGAMTAIGGAAFAGPLVPSRVAKDSKWVVHVDGEALLQSQIGQYLADKLIESEFGKFNAELKKSVGAELAWRKTKSLTAYGSDFKADGQANGILLIEGPVGLVELLDGIKDKQDAAKAAPAATPVPGTAPAAGLPLGDLQIIGSGAEKIYIWKKEQFAAVLGPDLFAIARSKEELARAKSVIAGKTPSLAADAGSVPDITYTPIIQAMAPKGLEDAGLSGPAEMLRHCRNGQAALGEKEKDVVLDLHVAANDTATATQIKQIVQGLVALGMLAGDKNADAQKLAGGTTVDSKAQDVMLGIHLPVDDVIAKIDETQKPETKKADHPKKKKKKNANS